MDHADEARLARYLEDALGWRGVTTRLISQFTRGAARSSFGVWVEQDSAAGRCTAEFVLKQDPLGEDASMVPGSVLTEHEWYAAMWATGGVLVPEPVVAESSGTVLGSPFMMTRMVRGRSDQAGLFGPAFDETTRQAIAQQAFQRLGEIAAVDVRKLASLAEELAGISTETAWRKQLDKWEGIHDQYNLGPLPMIRAAIRALRANPPPPLADLHVVHGDFKFENCLHSPDGVHAILDWEMAHFGDPHEDLAWAMKVNFRRPDRTKVWGFVEDEASVVSEWERASGLTLNNQALAWWTLFSHVKLAALFLKAGAAVAAGVSDRVYYVLAHWLGTPNEEAMIAQDIEKVRR